MNEMSAQSRIIDSISTIITEYTRDFDEVQYILKKVKQKCIDDVFQAANKETNSE